jgi:hypothetical protein
MQPKGYLMLLQDPYSVEVLELQLLLFGLMQLDQFY